MWLYKTVDGDCTLFSGCNRINCIRGAALDMVESEDPDLDTCPLVGRDDVLLTPHSGYYSDTSNYLVAKLSMDNALYYVNGEYDKVKSIRNGVNA